MSDRPHGTRATYQKGCRCRPCTDANTHYEQSYRQIKAKGLPCLRTLVSAQQAAKWIRELQQEGLMRKGEIAKALGYKQPILKLSTGNRAKMVLRNLLKIKRLRRIRLRLDAESA